MEGRGKERELKEKISLRLLPFYTGARFLNEALSDPRAKKLLWLEILFNEEVNWNLLLHIPEVKEAYEKACVWYFNFETLLQDKIKGKHLQPKRGKIDMRDYRIFVEALNFVSGQS